MYSIIAHITLTLKIFLSSVTFFFYLLKPINAPVKISVPYIYTTGFSTVIMDLFRRFVYHFISFPITCCLYYRFTIQTYPLYFVTLFLQRVITFFLEVLKIVTNQFVFPLKFSFQLYYFRPSQTTVNFYLKYINWYY